MKKINGLLAIMEYEELMGRFVSESEYDYPSLKPMRVIGEVLDFPKHSELLDEKTDKVAIDFGEEFGGIIDIPLNCDSLEFIIDTRIWRKNKKGGKKK